MEDELPDASIDELVELCVAAKVRRLTFDGYSPLQWWFGTQCAREVEEQGHRLQFQDSCQNSLWFLPTLGRPCAYTYIYIYIWASMRDHVY